MDGPLTSPSKRAVSTERKKRTETRPTGDGLAGFYVMVTGQVESADFRGLDNLFCRYTFSYGPDWRILQGIDHGFSQVAQKNSTNSSNGIVWNFPIDVTFKTTNPHGWPRIIVSVYSQDLFGRYVIRGYGSVLVPTVPGKYTRYIRTFAPVSSTYLQAALGWLTGNLPEFYDSRFIANNEGREVVRVQSTGTVRVQFNVLSRGMASHGYTTGGPPDAPDLDSEASLVPGGGRRASLTTNTRTMTGDGFGASMRAVSTTSGRIPPSMTSVSNDRPPLVTNSSINNSSTVVTERPMIRTEIESSSSSRKIIENNNNDDVVGGSRMATTTTVSNENNGGSRSRLAAVDEDRDRDRQRRRDYSNDDTTGRDRGRDRDRDTTTTTTVRERKPADSLSPNRN